MWANSKPENGLDGGRMTPESAIKNSNSVRKYFEGNIKARDNLRNHQLLKWSDENYRKNQQVKQSESWNDGGTRAKRVTGMTNTRRTPE